MSFFSKQPDFDELLGQVRDETAKSVFLHRYLEIELARAWLKESGVKFSVADILAVAKGIAGK